MLSRPGPALLTFSDFPFVPGAWRRFSRAIGHLVVVVALVSLGIANLHLRLTFAEVEDGVLWELTRAGVIVATEIAPGTPAEREGIRPGDTLVAIRAPGLHHVVHHDRHLHQHSM